MCSQCHICIVHLSSLSGVYETDPCMDAIGFWFMSSLSCSEWHSRKFLLSMLDNLLSMLFYSSLPSGWCSNHTQTVNKYVKCSLFWIEINSTISLEVYCEFCHCMYMIMGYEGYKLMISSPPNVEDVGWDLRICVRLSRWDKHRIALWTLLLSRD